MHRDVDLGLDLGSGRGVLPLAADAVRHAMARFELHAPSVARALTGADTPVPRAVDVDASWRPPRVRSAARFPPLRKPAAATRPRAHLRPGHPLLGREATGPPQLPACRAGSGLSRADPGALTGCGHGQPPRRRHHLRRRQDGGDDGAVPGLRPPRPVGGAVQGAEHVQQLDGHRRRCRDRARPVGAGAGGARGARVGDEPGAAQAGQRPGQPRGGAGSPGRAPRRDGVRRRPRRARRGGPFGVRRAGGALRRRRVRGCRKPRGGQPAGVGLRQHGPRPARPDPHRRGRRHRPRWGVRRDVRHPRAARRGRPGAGPRLGGQQVPRRPRPAPARPRHPGGADRAAGARRAAVAARPVARLRGLAGAARSRTPDGARGRPAPRGGRGAAAGQQLHRR